MTAISLPPVSVFDDSQDIFINECDIRKNLAKEFDTPKEVDKHLSRISKQMYVDESVCMRAYLRIRPFTKVEIRGNEDQNCMEVMEDNRTLHLNPPACSNMYKANSRGVGEMPHTFIFSNIFKPEIGQKEFFDKTALPLVEDFIEGQNSLIFTYGVTSSGKTYTIQGNPGNEGIMPRSVDVIFNSIGDQVVQDSVLQLTKAKTLTILSDKVKQQNLKEKMLLMASAEKMEPKKQTTTGLNKDSLEPSIDVGKKSLTANVTENSGTSISLDGGCSSADNSLVTSASRASFLDFSRSRIADSSFVDVSKQGNVKFIIYVSYIEIYNEMIFDLLQPLPKRKKIKRDPLKLAEDRNIPFVKGVQQIQVNSREEIFKLLAVGRNHLQMAETKLNHNSSRSHCIFTIKTVCVEDIENPTTARIAQMVFCDLAGSERSQKTQSVGDRLKEAGKINSSLMALGKCIGILRSNQQQPTSSQRLVPYRESRLTQLFQSFLVGHGRACMVVNANMCASLFDENAQVLKFSAVASQVKLEKLAEARLSKRLSRRSRISVAVDKAMTPIKEILEEEEEGTSWDEENDDGDLSWSDIRRWEEREEELIGVINMLKEEFIKERQRMYKIEEEVRKECQQEQAKAFTEIDAEWKDEVQSVVDDGNSKIKELQEDLYKSRKMELELDEECMEYDAKLAAECEKNEKLTKQLNEATKQHNKNLNDAYSKATEFEMNFNIANESLKAKEKELKSLTLKLQRSRRSSTVAEREKFITELQEENEIGKSLIQEHVNQLKELRNNYEELSEHKNMIEEESQVHVEEIKRMKSENIVSAKQITDLEKQLSEVQEQKSKEEKLNVDNGSRILESQNEIKDLKKTILELQENENQYKCEFLTKLDEAGKSNKELKEKYDADMTTNNAEIKSLKTKIRELENICENDRSVIESLGVELNNLQTSHKAKEKELIEMAKELEENKEVVVVELLELKSEAKEKSAKNEELLKELNINLEVTKTQGSEIKSLKDEVDILKEDLLGKSGTISNMEGKHKSEVKQILIEHKSKLQEWQTKLKESEKARAELEKDHNIASRLESQLMSEVESLQKDLNMLRKEKSKVTNDHSSRISQVSELERDLSILTSEREDFVKTTSKLQSDLDDARKEVKQLKSEVPIPGVKEATSLEQLKQSLRNMETKQAENLEMIENMKNEKQMTESRNIELTKKLEALENDRGELKQTIKQVEKSRDDAEGMRSELAASLDQTQKQVHDLEEKLCLLEKNSKKKDIEDSLVIKEHKIKIVALEKEVIAANQSKEKEMQRFREGRDKISASLDLQIKTQKSFSKVLQERLDEQLLVNENLREEITTLKKDEKKKSTKQASKTSEAKENQNEPAKTPLKTPLRPFVKLEMMSPEQIDTFASPIAEKVNIGESSQTPMETVTMANLSTEMTGTPLSSIQPHQIDESAHSSKGEEEVAVEPPRRGQRKRASKQQPAIRKVSSRKKRTTAIQNRKDTPVANNEENVENALPPKKQRRTRASKQVSKVVVKQEVVESDGSENATLTNENTDVLDDSDLQRATGKSRGFPKPSLEIDVTPQLKKPVKERKKTRKASKVETDTGISSAADIRDRLAKRLKMFEFQSEVDSEQDEEAARGRSRGRKKVEDGDNISLGKSMSRMKEKLLRNSPISQVAKRIEAAISPSRSPNISSPQHSSRFNDAGRKSTRKTRKLHPEDISAPLECTPTDVDPPTETTARRLRKRK